MAQHTRVAIVDPTGQRKDYSVEKTLFFVGSDSNNDIVLPSSRNDNIYPRHIQIIVLNEGSYRLVNLANDNVIVGQGERKEPLQPRSSVNVSAGQHIILDSFTLVLEAEENASLGISYATAPSPTEEEETTKKGGKSKRTARSKFIGLTLTLSNTLLTLDTPIEGSVTVRNLGDKPGVQFWLQLEGLEPESYTLGPGPILFPDAEKSTALRLTHPKKPYPEAGEHRFSVRASAPEDYPGDSVIVSQTIQIMPFYKHKLRLLESN